MVAASDPGVPGSDKLYHRTLADQIADRLRRDILFGAIGPDQRLTQESICQRFNTSRIPVRDAVQRLMHDGLMERVPNGLRAVLMTKEDLVEMFLIEGHLHGLASRLMVERATDGELNGLVLLNDEMRAAFDAEKYELVAAVNGRFHRMVNKLAKSRQLLKLLRVNSTRIDSEYLMHFPHKTGHAMRQHDLFLEAVLARNADAAFEIMSEHVFDSTESLQTTATRKEAPDEKLA